MEQQQFKVSLSLGTKLLISGVVLLVTVIAFLNLSTIFLLQKDKTAYVYESQSAYAALAGRGFSNTVRRVLDTLRLTLVSIDPAKPLTAQERGRVQSVVENQTDAPVVSIFFVDQGSLSFEQVLEARNEKEVKEQGYSELKAVLPQENAREWMENLLSRGFAFMNLSRMGGLPMLGVLVADTKMKSGKIPFALALVSMQDFVKQLAGLNMTIATKRGDILFDTNVAAQFDVKNIGSDALFQRAIMSQLSTGTMEYVSSDVKYLGTYLNTGLDIVVVVRTEWDKAMKATYALTYKFILLGIIAIGAAVMFTIVFSRSLTAPIFRLYEATKEVASGNFNLSLMSTSRDEIGALTGSFNVMSRQIAELIREKMKKMAIENEIMIAATVQQTLIPPPVYETKKIEIRSHYQAAESCGGDWWGFFEVGDRMCLMIADATGHGLPSALITASARSCFSVMHKLAQEDEDFSFSPRAMLSYANRVIYEASQGQILMTFFVATIDFSKMTLTYANGGQPPPWLFKKEASGQYQQMSLVSRSTRLGERVEFSDFPEETVPLGTGDLLFLYTDGLLEGKNKAGVMYGKRRVREITSKAVPQGPSELLSKLVSDFNVHNDGKPLDDDLTLAVAKILGPT